MLTVNCLNSFLSILQQYLTGQIISTTNNIDVLDANLDNTYNAFVEELEINLLNQSKKSQKLHLEDVFSEFRQFASFMTRSNRDIEDSLASKGFEVMFKACDDRVELAALASDLDTDLLEECRLYRVRNRLVSGPSVEEVLATFDAFDWQVYQKDRAAALLKEAWQKLSDLYARRGGMVSEAPRKTGELPVVRTAVIEDLRAYVPGMREMSISYYPTEAHGLVEWARHLTSLTWWNYPYSRPWLAPLDYEQAFHNAPDRHAFLLGLRRLLDAIEPVLAKPDEDNPLFREDNSALSVQQRIEIRQRMLHRARINARRIRQWLQLRQSTPSVQLMEALERILLVPIWSWKGEPSDKLTVASEHSNEEVTLRFQMLIARFKDDMPKTSYELTSLRNRLTQIIDYTIVEQSNSKLATYSLAALIDQMPQFNFVEELQGATITEIADEFWAKLSHILSCRLPWAKQASQLVDEALAEEANKGILSLANRQEKVSLRQIALLCIYQGKEIHNDGRAAELAREYGHTSGEALYRKFLSVKHTTNRTNVQGSEIRPMINDIEAIIPRLNKLQKQSAEDEISIIKAKM